MFQRDRKPKLYTDDWAIADEEIEGGRLFQLDDKLESDRFEQNFVKELNGKGICVFNCLFDYLSIFFKVLTFHLFSEFNVQYMQRHGFSTPLLFKEKSGLGIVVPSKNFSINDVRTCVGKRNFHFMCESRLLKLRLCCGEA